VQRVESRCVQLNRGQFPKIQLVGYTTFPSANTVLKGAGRTQTRWEEPQHAPKDPQTQNRYAYVRNNPMSYTDPTGGMLCLQCTGYAGGGCEPDDPYCVMCDPEDPFCGYVGGITFIGDGGPAQDVRKFPWLPLSVGFFSALESGGGNHDYSPIRVPGCVPGLVFCLQKVGQVVDPNIDPAWFTKCVSACQESTPPWHWPGCVGDCAVTYATKVVGGVGAEGVGIPICVAQFLCCIKGLDKNCNP
jgi:hypothetical protein